MFVLVVLLVYCIFAFNVLGWKIKSTSVQGDKLKVLLTI